MQVNGVNPNVGVTKNGNEYQKSKMGKRIGRDAGLAYATYRTYQVIKSGSFSTLVEPSVTRLGELSKFFAKYPGVAKWGMIGTGVALGSLLTVGIGKLVGHCVDKVVESRRKKAADKAAAAE